MEMNLLKQSKDRVTLQMIGQFWESRDFKLFHQKIRDLLNEQVKHFYIDLSRVSFVSSQGLGLLVTVFSEVTKLGCRFSLLRPKGCVKEVIEISNLDMAIPIVNSEDELSS